jgi:hypothetical protein
MITWRDTGMKSYCADLRFRGMTIARLEAYPHQWVINLLDGTMVGRAESLGHAKRGCLEELAKLLPDLEHEVQVALRTA